MAKKKVLFFGDFGVDDVLALMYAHFSEEIEVVGIVAEYGNISKKDAIENAAYLQQLVGTDIPIIGGAEVPLTGIKPKFFPEIHGEKGLGPIVPVVEIGRPFENFFEINRIIEKHQKELVIVSVGRLSALATTFILYPSTIELLKEIYIMGGAFLAPGNVTPVAEANFYSDPYAVNIVFQASPVPLYIVPLDVTEYAILTPELTDKIQQVYNDRNHEFGKIFKPMVDYYYQFYSSQVKGIKGCPLHDVLALWALCHPNDVHFIDVPIHIIVSQGRAFGQSVGDFRGLKEKAEDPVHYVAMSFQYEKFIDDFYQVMTNI